MKHVKVPKPVSGGYKKVDGSDADPITFGEFCVMALDMHQPLGTGISNIRKAAKIHDKVKDAKGTLKLENEEHVMLKKAIEEAKWHPKVAKMLIPFFDAIESPKDE